MVKLKPKKIKKEKGCIVMKKKDLPKIIIIAIVILFVIPLLINLSFKIDSIRLLAAEWTAGDLLSFYGAVLGAVITLIGLAITLDYQSKQARKDDEIKYKPILKLSAGEVEYNGFMGRREVKILFPFFGFGGDEFATQKEILFYRQMEETSDFHLIFENKGRGEASEAFLDCVEISEVTWDDNSHLYIAAGGSNLSLGEILVNETADIIISIPNFLFLRKGHDEKHIWIVLTISYDDMFHRNKRTMKILSDFKIIPINEAPAPYFYKEDFEYYEVEARFMGYQQID